MTAEIQNYLYEHIPLSKSMGVRVEEVKNNRVVLFAPLAANINHRDTVFGGSASALAILSAWTLLNFRLKHEGLDCRLVIQKNSVSYDKPITGDFLAICEFSDDLRWKKFKAMYKRKHKARIQIDSRLEHKGETVGSFSGHFVAIAVV